jgi:hypothetical protein
MNITVTLNGHSKKLNNVYYIDLENQLVKCYPSEKDLSFICDNFYNCSMLWQVDDIVKASLHYDTIEID